MNFSPQPKVLIVFLYAIKNASNRQHFLKFNV